MSIFNNLAIVSGKDRVRASDILVAVAGGYGTLSEMALALNADKPVIGLKTWKEIPGVHYADDYLEAIQLISLSLSSKVMKPQKGAKGTKNKIGI